MQVDFGPMRDMSDTSSGGSAPPEDVVVIVDNPIQMEVCFITERQGIDPIWVPFHSVTEPITRCYSACQVIQSWFMPYRYDVGVELEFRSEKAPRR